MRCLLQLAKIFSPNLISVTTRLAWPQLPYSTYLQSLIKVYNSRGLSIAWALPTSTMCGIFFNVALSGNSIIIDKLVLTFLVQSTPLLLDPFHTIVSPQKHQCRSTTTLPIGLKFTNSGYEIFIKYIVSGFPLHKWSVKRTVDFQYFSLHFMKISSDISQSLHE